MDIRTDKKLKKIHSLLIRLRIGICFKIFSVSRAWCTCSWKSPLQSFKLIKFTEPAERGAWNGQTRHLFTRCENDNKEQQRPFQNEKSTIQFNQIMLIKGLLIHPRPLRVIVLQMATVPEYLQPLLHTNWIVYDISLVMSTRPWNQFEHKSQPKVELGIFVRLEKDTKGSYLLSALLPLWWRSFGDSSPVSVILALVMDRSCLSITWEISWLARHASINRPLHEGIRLRLYKSSKTAKLWLGLTFGILPATSFGRNGFVWNSVLKSPLFLLSTPTGTYYTYIR